jgi:transketolase
MFAAHNKLNKLIAFVDHNKQQLDGFTKDIIDMGDIGKKFSSFGWHTQSIDGHNLAAIKAAIKEAKKTADKPSVIILDTIKGYGCDFAEAVEANHHMNFTKEQIQGAVEAAEQKLEYARELAKEGA